MTHFTESLCTGNTRIEYKICMLLLYTYSLYDNILLELSDLDLYLIILVKWLKVLCLKIQPDYLKMSNLA